MVVVTLLDHFWTISRPLLDPEYLVDAITRFCCICISIYCADVHHQDCAYGACQCNLSIVLTYSKFPDAEPAQPGPAAALLSCLRLISILLLYGTGVMSVATSRHSLIVGTPPTGIPPKYWRCSETFDVSIPMCYGSPGRYHEGQVTADRLVGRSEVLDICTWVCGALRNIGHVTNWDFDGVVQDTMDR
jgi:hypothetical protein